MARDELCLIKPGSTYFNGDKIKPDDQGSGLPGTLCGKTARFEAMAPVDPATDPTNYFQDLATTDSTGRYTDVVILRNVSGVNLKPGRLIRFAPVTNYPYGTATDGYATGATGELIAGFVDPYITAAGVPNLDVFLCFFRGPAMATAGPSGNISVAPGASLVPLADTNANAQTDDGGGRVTTIAANPQAPDYDSRVGVADVRSAIVDANKMFAIYARINKF